MMPASRGGVARRAGACGAAARGRGARPGAIYGVPTRSPIYREFCHPLLSRLARTSPGGCGTLACFNFGSFLHSVSRECVRQTQRSCLLLLACDRDASRRSARRRTTHASYYPLPSQPVRQRARASGWAGDPPRQWHLSLSRHSLRSGASAWCWAAIRPSSAAGRARCAASAARGRCA